MAAPNEVVWGSIVGDYGRLGLYINVTTNTETTYSGDVQVWFWSKYTIDDTTNTLYFDNLAESGSATTSKGSLHVETTVASGSGWSTTNQVKLASYSFSYSKGTAVVTRYIYTKLAKIDRVGGTMYASTTLSIPKLASYTVSYNANGGSGAPSSQTKWYGTALTLSSTKPTRTGYSFQGWSTANDSSVEYAAGANYTANAAVTLYAVWKANTYTVTYNANGGTGAPGNQTKTYGTTLKLSSTIPTRTNYNFIGWGTSATSTTVTYKAGANYTDNAAVTLYAIWELAYIKPKIYNLSASRCDSNGAIKEDGLYGLIKFNWEITSTVKLSKIIITWTSSIGSGSKEITASGTSGSKAEIIGGNLSADASYTVTVEVVDSIDSNRANTTLNGTAMPIDAIRTDEGIGVSFGKPAEHVGMAEFALDAKFNKPVYGKALGMDRLPAIAANSNFNDYMETGCYAVQSNAIAETCANIPITRAGRLEVWAATGEGVRAEQWSYLRQRYIPYNSGNAVWERELTRGDDNVWHYYEWWRSSLTPAASQKVYSKAAIMIGLNANSTMSAASAYTKIPFDLSIMSLNDRLTFSENSVRIGADIDYVKVSANILVKCGAAGTRHFRIQKISNGTTTSHAWVVTNAEAGNNAAYIFTPFIIPVKEGDLIRIVYYTVDTTDYVVSGSSANGRQSYLTVEEL